MKEYNNEQYEITLTAGDHTSKGNGPAGHLSQYDINRDSQLKDSRKNNVLSSRRKNGKKAVVLTEMGRLLLAQEKRDRKETIVE